MTLKLAHIGVLVDDIDSACTAYRVLFGSENISNKTRIESQGVYVCFVKVSDDVCIELVQPLNEDSIIYKLRKKGFTYYHLGYFVRNFDDICIRLKKKKFRQLNIFKSEAFQNQRCSFFMTPDVHLIELIEIT